MASFFLTEVNVRKGLANFEAFILQGDLIYFYSVKWITLGTW